MLLPSDKFILACHIKWLVNGMRVCFAALPNEFILLRFGDYRACKTALLIYGRKYGLDMLISVKERVQEINSPSTVTSPFHQNNPDMSE